MSEDMSAPPISIGMVDSGPGPPDSRLRDKLRLLDFFRSPGISCRDTGLY